jgi:hypothetical protein
MLCKRYVEPFTENLSYVVLLLLWLLACTHAEGKERRNRSIEDITSLGAGTCIYPEARPLHSSGLLRHFRASVSAGSRSGSRLLVLFNEHR